MSETTQVGLLGTLIERLAAKLKCLNDHQHYCLDCDRSFGPELLDEIDAALKAAALPPVPPQGQEPQCIGPFSDAFDCPVHDPRKLAASPLAQAQELDTQRRAVMIALAEEAVKIPQGRDGHQRFFTSNQALIRDLLIEVRTLDRQCEETTQELTVLHNTCGHYEEEIARLKAALPPAQGWQPIETAPKGREVWFWIVPKSADESYTDTSGNPITAGNFPPAARFTKYGYWGALFKATHWHEDTTPSPPVAQGWHAEKDK